MGNKALVIIDIQNDITKNYKEVINNINQVIEWAVANKIEVVYIRHENLSLGTRTFKTGTLGAELVSDMKIASDNIFTKCKGNSLTSEGFVNFIKTHKINEFYLAGADAVACVKSTCFNMCKVGYRVHVIADCVTSYDKRKIPEMIEYYKNQGSIITTFKELVHSNAS